MRVSPRKALTFFSDTLLHEILSPPILHATLTDPPTMPFGSHTLSRTLASLSEDSEDQPPQLEELVAKEGEGQSTRRKAA
jgi:hypothetical protein